MCPVSEAVPHTPIPDRSASARIGRAFGLFSALLTAPALLAQADSRDVGEGLTVRVDCARQHVYVGERVELTLHIEVVAARWGGQILDEVTMLRGLSPLNFGPFPVGPPARTRVLSTADADALPVYAYEWDATILVRHTDALRFDDIAVELTSPSTDGNVALRAGSAATTIKVLPVPQRGRPRNYSGAVGVFAMQVSASSTDVRVGDPIQMTINVFGDGPVETLPPPNLTADEELVHSFRLPEGPLAGEFVDSIRRFVLTIRARHENVEQIPALLYPYFDPVEERFIIARSEPIAIRVRPAVTTVYPFRDRALSGPPFETRAAVLLRNTPDVSPTAVAVVTLLPPLAFLGVWAALALRTRGFALAALILLSIGGLATAARAQVIEPLSSKRRAEVLTAAVQGLQLADDAVARGDDPRPHLQQAAAGFRALRDAGLRNAGLEFNLGQLYRRLEQPGLAMLHLLRAQRMAPLDSRVRQGLDELRNSAAISSVGRGTPVESGASALLQLGLPPHARFRVLCGCATLTWTAMFIWLRWRRRAVLTIGLCGLVATLVCASSLAWQIYRESCHPSAVVVGCPTLLRASRANTHPATPEEHLPPGTEVYVHEQRGDWFAVTTRGGRSGWLRHTAIQQVRPSTADYSSY